MRWIISSLCAGLCLVAMGAGATAIGDKVEDITFKDIRYLPRTLNDFGERKAFAFLFTQMADPGNAAALERLKALHAEFAGTGVEVASLNVGVEDTVMETAQQAIENGYTFTVLKDFHGHCAKALGVEKNGTAVVLGGDRTLRYRGSLDGVADAIKAVLAGEAPAQKEGAVEGAVFAMREVPAAAAPVTFTKDIAPIMYKNCLECHRPGESAPFSLKTYGQVSSRADMIGEVVLEERMPPWYGSRHFGPFINERVLMQDEKDKIAQWILAGKPEGEAADLPEAPVYPDSDWKIGEPDLIIEAEQTEELPADGFIPYRYVKFPYKFEEDTWVQGLEILPSNPEVVHHANLAYSQVGEGYEEKFNFLTGRVPGGSPVDLMGPVAMLIPKDSILLIQIHYVTTGQVETDRMRIGVRFAKSDVIKQVHFRRIRPENIAIPAYDPFHEMSAQETIDTDAMVVALFTHMHVRGRDMSFWADYPDGKSEKLLIVPNYSFDWQLAYQYQPGSKMFPKGTKVRTVSHYDNSTFNPYNPDPTQDVPYGDQTIHEMNDAYVFYIDQHENLALKINPANGQVVTQPSK
ncbi:MAG: redoxin domain-containing protein [Candidatus Hydrogenedentes bacterium]|nr:redoxin domain-containing protein [Candidatus Hydrogenedentota bacterium]